MNYNGSSLLHYATFNATQTGTYNLRLWANDSAGNSAYSNIINITVEYERTWARTPSVFTPIATTYGTNVSLGDLIIDNTGDFEFNFTIVSDSNVTLYNTTENFTLAAKGTKTIQINDTATETGIKTITLNISAEPDANPTSQTSTGTIVVAPGQPILVATFTTPTTETLTQTQGDTNIEFTARLENIGEGNASNVTFFIDLPSEWTITFGQINKSISTLNSGDYEDLSIEVTIPSSATTGVQDVIANATGLNQSGTNLHSLGLIFSDLVEVTVDALPTVLGAEEVVTPTVGGSLPSAGTGGAAGSGGGLSISRAQEIIKVKRGTSQTAALGVTNIYSNTILENVELELTGFMSQYITWTPEMIKQIAYNKTDNFFLDIFVPPYLTEAEYNLTAKITAEIVPLNPKLSGYERKTVVEYRTIILKVEEVDIVDLSSELSAADQCIAEMKEAGLPHSTLIDLLAKSGEQIRNEDYKEAKASLTQICTLKKTAFSAYELILSLEEKIKQAELEGLEVPDTRDELALAKIALNREDFALALQRAKDAELTQILETKGQFNITKYIMNNWCKLLISFIMLLLFLFFVYKRIRIWLIKRRIKNLYLEEKSIKDLIIEAQRNYTKGKKISSSQYDRYEAQYEERLSKIKQDRIKLRNKRAVAISIKQELKYLQKEKKEVQKQTKAIQENYLIHKTLNKTQFNNEYKSNKSRMAEISAEEQILKKRLSTKKSSHKVIPGLRKLVSIRFYTNIFKKKKTSRKRGRKKRR